MLLELNDYKWMPVIDEARCTGCELCVNACGPHSLSMRAGVAALSAPETRGSEEHCTGHYSAARSSALAIHSQPRDPAGARV